MRHQILRKSIYTTAVALTCLVSLVHAGVASAVTSNDLFSIRSYTPYYDPTATACGGGNDVSAVETGTGNATLNLTGAQVAIAKVIIGIAKTDNVGQAGALIGLMVALTESELKIYANSNVPLSMNNPNKQAVGSNYDSLGVYQQRISMGWSTISSSPSNLAAVNQLMDPAYNAEAFFGSPPGSSAPSALSKGLLNVSG